MATKPSTTLKLNKPPLTPEFCLQVVISCTPKPSRWNPATDTPSGNPL